MHKWSFLALASAVTLLGGRIHAQNVKQAANATAEARVTLDREWARIVAAEKKKDISTILSLYADDAIIMAPGVPDVIGKPAIADFMKTFFATTSVVEVTHHVTSFTVDGDVAIETGTITETDQEQGKPKTTETTRYILVLKRHSDGRWLALRDVELPAAPK